MKIPFTKMQGLGNDFVVIDNVTNNIALAPKIITQITDRHFGVGCDQVLILELPPKEMKQDVDFFYRVFNSDGGEAEQCGNGVRCLAKFVKIQGMNNKERLIFATKSTINRTFFERDGQVTAITNGPVFTPENIPFIAKKQELRYNLQISHDSNVEVGVVSVGNPHAVVLVLDVDQAPVGIMGPLIANCPYFPQKANVNFMQILDRRHIKLRVYERGSGETLACGSGAAAAVAVGKSWGFLESKVVVKLCGGDLAIQWNELDNTMAITGPAEQVFIGEIILAG